MTAPAPGRLDRPDGNVLAYHRSAGDSPAVVFCGGFMSDMTGTKACALESFCAERCQAYVRFDYLGHGASSGAFADGTIGRRAEDAVAVIDALSEGPVVLVGSSMGGWIMLLAALARRARVQALVGVAAAPDFTRRMVEDELTEAQRAALARDGRIEIPSDYGEAPYLITRALIDDGARHALLDGGIALTCPVRLLHGLKDAAVPWQTSLRLARALASADVTVTLVKDGDHRLSEPADLARLCAAVAEVSQPPARIARRPSR
ncbi:MAG TPA: alpha/beta hydrolase [Alphaproteobacteria bacterium]